ncbi:MAG TPA: hypothetical protein VF954_08115, partial [Acidimicrobiales bacterium]
MTLLAEPLERGPSPVGRRADLTAAVREQWSVAGGQLAAGAGNLAFVLLLARILPPHAFAQITAWLALFLLVNLPATSLGAGAALDPSTATRLARRSAVAGAGVGLGLILSAPLLTTLVGLPAGLVVALGLVAPLAGPVAVARGRLYGREHRRLVASLVVEPAVRLAVGGVLAAVAGAPGAVAGVLIAGAAALGVATFGGVASPGRRSHPAPLARLRQSSTRPWATPASPSSASSTGPTLVVFLLLAVIQNQDVVFANAVLRGNHAGTFAALSTL